MKYITTDKHPELKEGIDLETNASMFWAFSLSGSRHSISKPIKNDWIEKGYIKEVEEKEFTKSDMIGLLDFYTESQSENNVLVVDKYIEK